MNGERALPLLLTADIADVYGSVFIRAIRGKTISEPLSRRIGEGGLEKRKPCAEQDQVFGKKLRSKKLGCRTGPFFFYPPILLPKKSPLMT